MTDQNQAPERIFADLQCGTWFENEPWNEGEDVEYVRADLLEAAEKRIADLTEELNVTTRQGLIYKNERDELAVEVERQSRMQDGINAAERYWRKRYEGLTNRLREVEAASAAREIAMRDRAAGVAKECDDECECMGCCYTSIILDAIRALPLSPDGQQALDDVRAEEWDAGWMCRYNGGHYSDNPHRQPSRSSDAGKSEDRG